VACLCVLAGCGDGGVAASPGAGQGASRERGERLLAAYHCGTCHRIPGVAAARSHLAADLSGYGQRSYIAGRWPNEPGTLARWIADPAALAPGTLMPAMGASPADARDMAAYLMALHE